MNAKDPQAQIQAINAENAAYWSQPSAQLLDAALAMKDAHALASQRLRAKGTAASAAARKSKTADLYRKILDAYASGKKTHQIARKEEYGNRSPSRVRQIRRQHTPLK